jgi:hypothetical protein
MLFRSRATTPPQDWQSSPCRALVWVDTSLQKRTLVEQIRAMQQKIAEHEQRVRDFHRLAVPQFEAWMVKQFGKARQRIEELQAHRSKIEQRLSMAQQLLSYNPSLKKHQVEMLIDRAERDGLEPLLALHRWIQEQLKNAAEAGRESPQQRERRVMRAVQLASEALSDLILARYQQEFEGQGSLAVSAIPHEWTQELLLEFLEHYQREDGEPVLSLIFFLRLPDQQRRVEERVRAFLEQHFPRSNQGPEDQDRWGSFFSGFEELFEKLGGRRSRHGSSDEAGPAPERSEELKAVFRRLARQLHPDTGGPEASTSTQLWMEVQRHYQNGDVAMLLKIETELSLQAGQIRPDEVGLAQLLEAKSLLEAKLKTKKSEWSRLSRRPEAKLQKSENSPKKLQDLIRKFETEFTREQQALEEHLDQLQLAWFSLGQRRKRR